MSPVLPELLESYRKQIHAHEAAVRGRFDQWALERTPVPNEGEDEALWNFYESVQRIPKTREAQAQLFAAKVRLDGWTRQQIPKDFWQDVAKLIKGSQ